MAFKKRVKNDKPTRTEKSVKVEDSVSVGLMNKKVDTSTPAEREAAGFKEQAKEVLNILESKGIDFYDENRTGGMYLRGRKSQTLKLVNKPNREVVDEQKNNFLKKILNR